MLDLDVGFIDDPMKIVSKLHNSRSDIFVQVCLGTPFACSGAYSADVYPHADGYYLYYEPHTGGLADVVHCASAQYW
jgi:hypothetical protein